MIRIAFISFVLISTTAFAEIPAQPSSFATITLRQNLPKLRRAVRNFSTLWTHEGSPFPAVDETVLLRMVAAIGLVELTAMQPEDHIQDLVSRLPGGRTMSRGGTLGAFQVSTHLAYSLENMYLQFTNLRPHGPWNETEIARNLAGFEVNAAYATAFVYHIFKAFQNRGIDLTDEPGIVATLYNTGVVEESARRAANRALPSAQRMPRLNDHGRFVENNWAIVESLIP